MPEGELSYTDHIDFSEVSRPVLSLAAKIRKIHGDVRIASGGRGVHLEFASPVCLEQQGEVEFHKKHLALNADRYLYQGAWSRKKGTYDNDRSAMCMKTGKPYKVSELLDMKPIEARGFKREGLGEISTAPRAKLIEDGRGNLIPDHPGKVVPLVDLPHDHPAIEYIRSRGYDPVRLHFQFRCGFCTEEAPEGEEYGRFYRRLPGGWKDTPQGRVIFYCDVEGVQLGWQARILDRVVGMRKQHFHPYRMDWVTTHTLEQTEKGMEWVLVDTLKDEPIPFTDRLRKWEPAKYKTATGARRNQLLMGLDAAVLWNQGTGLPKEKWRCLLVEGPLDGARLGAPTIPVLGKYFSKEQGIAVLKHFKHVGVVRDKDKAGDKLLGYVRKFLQERVVLHSFDPPVEEGQDPGDMSPEDAAQFARECLGKML